MIVLRYGICTKNKTYLFLFFTNTRFAMKKDILATFATAVLGGVLLLSCDLAEENVAPTSPSVAITEEVKGQFLSLGFDPSDRDWTRLGYASL